MNLRGFILGLLPYTVFEVLHYVCVLDTSVLNLLLQPSAVLNAYG